MNRAHNKDWVVHEIIYFILNFLLSSCGSLHSGSPALDAIYSGTSAVIKSDGVASRFEQGHAQDRVNCRKSKQAQVNTITKSRKISVLSYK